MKLNRFYTLAFFVAFLLTACSGSSVELDPAVEQSPVMETGQMTAQEPGSLSIESNASTETTETTETMLEQGSLGDQDQTLWPDGEVQLDKQGFVEVAITPLNLNALNDALDFSVGLNTHSVDLGMDLAPLATLEADNGLGVQAVLWEAPRGGHHVSGVLSFPATVDGARLLEGASRLTLTIRDVDTPERSFAWSLAG
jgi:hypothetical protein